MDDRSLESLLRAAGQLDVPALALDPDLAQRVRQRQRRRRLRQRAASVVALGGLLLGGVTSWLVFSPAPPEAPDRRIAAQPGSPSQVALPPVTSLTAAEKERLRKEIAQLDAEATRRWQTLKPILSATAIERRLRQSADEALGPDPLDAARIELEKTAFLLVDLAQQQAATAQTETARAGYRRILNTFPHTRAAQTARERLEQLPHEQGDL